MIVTRKGERFLLEFIRNYELPDLEGVSWINDPSNAAKMKVIKISFVDPDPKYHTSLSTTVFYQNQNLESVFELKRMIENRIEGLLSTMRRPRLKIVD